MGGGMGWWQRFSDTGGVVPVGRAKRKPNCPVIIYREVILQNSGRLSFALKVPV